MNFQDFNFYTKTETDKTNQNNIYNHNTNNNTESETNGGTDIETIYKKYVKSIEEAHVWKKILYPGFYFKPQVLDQIQRFKVRPDDIIIATFPKSGTTWTAEIVSLIRSRVNLDYVRSLDVSDRVVHLETPPNMSLECWDKLESPRIFGTHLPYHLLPTTIKQMPCKVIYVMRNPKDVAVSFFHHHRMAKDLGNFSGSFKEFLKLFTAGKTVCGSWFDHVTGYWNQTEKNILFLRFEDMKKNFGANIERIANFINVPLDREQIDQVSHHCSFEVMKHNEKANRNWIPTFDKSKGHFMRKGQVGDWKNHFDAEDNQYFMQVFKQKMQHCKNLNFEWESQPHTSFQDTSGSPLTSKMSFSTPFCLNSLDSKPTLPTHQQPTSINLNAPICV